MIAGKLHVARNSCLEMMLSGSVILLLKIVFLARVLSANVKNDSKPKLLEFCLQMVPLRLDVLVSLLQLAHFPPQLIHFD